MLSGGVVGRSIAGDLREELTRRVERDGEASARSWYRRAARGVVYLPFVGRNGADDWFVGSPAYTIRAANAASLMPVVRDVIRRRDLSLPVYAMQTMDDVVAESVARLSFTMLALGISALMALILGAVGL